MTPVERYQDRSLKDVTKDGETTRVVRRGLFGLFGGETILEKGSEAGGQIVVFNSISEVLENVSLGEGGVYHWGGNRFEGVSTEVMERKALNDQQYAEKVGMLKQYKAAQVARSLKS